MERIVYLEYLEEFGCYGIAKSELIAMKEKNIVADIRMPQDKMPQTARNAPTLGMLLGQDSANDGTEYYSIGQNYVTAAANTGSKVRFLDFEQPTAEMKKCDGIILIGGVFNNPEEFYIDGKTMGDEIGKRYFAYRSIIHQLHKDKKPVLGVCAGAQMLGSILGNMKMYRNLKEEVPQHIIHKPRAETDVRLHQIKLLKDTPIYDILGIDASQTTLNINSRHTQGMVHTALQDYVKGTPKVKMDLYAISSSDAIPEIWGNVNEGILCVQGHPEDLAAKGDKTMQKIYNHIANLSSQYKRNHAPKNLKVRESGRD